MQGSGGHARGGRGIVGGSVGGGVGWGWLTINRNLVGCRVGQNMSRHDDEDKKKEKKIVDRKRIGMCYELKRWEAEC